MRFIAEYTEEDGYEGDFHYSQEEIEDIRDFKFHLATSLSFSLNRIADDLYADDPEERKKFCQSIFDLAKATSELIYDRMMLDMKYEKDLSNIYDDLITKMRPVYEEFLEEEGFDEEQLVKLFRSCTPKPRISEKKGCYVFEVMEKGDKVLLLLGSVGINESKKRISKEAFKASVIVTYLCDKAFSKDDEKNFVRYGKANCFVYHDMLVEKGVINKGE